MKVLVVLSFDVPNVEAITAVLKKMDPPSIEYFTNEARIVPEPHATELEKWLDE